MSAGARTRYFVCAVVVCCVTSLFCELPSASAENDKETEARLTRKVDTIELRMRSKQAAGRDITEFVEQLKRFRQFMEAGQAASAEQTLDALLVSLNKPESSPVIPPDSSKPIPFTDEPQYLIFMPSGDEKIYEAPSPYSEIDRFARKLLDTFGTAGSSKRKLGFGLVIPIWLLDKVSLEKLQTVIRDAFRVARDKKMAVFLSVDSHYAWQTRPDLWNCFDPKSPGFSPQNKCNVEWSDWRGTPYQHRYLDWGKPQALAPPMCVNAPKIKSEIRRLVERDIVPPVKAGLKELGDNQQLFAGITVTAEPMIENYAIVDRVNPQLAAFMQAQGAPKVRLGYNALTNAGYSQKNPPHDYEVALGNVNQDFGAYWAEKFVRAGIPSSRLYTHVAASAGVPGTPSCSFSNAPISSAFNRYCRPGWTTYAAGPLAKGFEPLYAELRKHNNPHWASSEANPAVFDGPPFSTYEYLRRHYGYGATVVVMNTGATSSEAVQKMERGAFRPESIAAYRRFLGEHP